MRGRINVSDKMVYKYGSIASLVMSGLIVLFGSWIRLTSEMAALIRLGNNWLFEGILDYLDGSSAAVYNHLKAGKLTLLDMHKIIRAIGAIYRAFEEDDPFTLIGLIPIAALIMLFIVVVAEIVLRILDKEIVFLTAVVELFIWIAVLVFVLVVNGGFKDSFYYSITALRVSFLPILAVVLAVVSGVLWISYKKMNAASPSFAGYNSSPSYAGYNSSPSYTGNNSANWKMIPSAPYKYDSNKNYNGYASSPDPNKAAFGGARRQGGAPDGRRFCPNCGAPLSSTSRFCGKCGSQVN